MPRRFLGARLTPASYERMKGAINRELERPRFDELVESQDQKLEVIKRSVINSGTSPVKLIAGQALLLSAVIDAPQPAVMISTHYNDTEQSMIMGNIQLLSDIDFSKAEDFLELETPMDARRDHNVLKLALSIPNRTFMSRIMHRHPVNRKRLAFIQRRLAPFKTSEQGAGRHQPASTASTSSSSSSAAKQSENKEVVVSCLVCGMRFNRQHQFQRHILTHPDPDNKRFLCQICGKRFNRADHLNRHAVLHGDVHVHKCLICGEEFDRASHLDRHRRKHHPPVGQAPSQTPPLTPQLKSPLGRGYLSPSPSHPQQASHETIGSGSNLHLLAAVATPEEDTLLETVPDNYIQTQVVAMENMEDAYTNDPSGLQDQEDHSGGDEAEPTRPFVCEMCGRKFIRATHLRRHVRIHTGEKPFACHICGRRYARGDYLRAHIQAHRRDKIHKCKHCGDVFQDLTRFADHCRIVHKDVSDEYGNPCPPPPDTPPAHQVCIAEDPLELEGAEISLVVSAVSPLSLPIAYVTSDEQGVELVANVLSSPQQHPLGIPLLTPLMSSEFQISQLQTLDPQSDIHNSHVPETGNEVVVLSQPKESHYIDHYIINNSGLSP